MSTPAAITAVILSLNDEARVRASAASALAGEADVVVVDGGSTDGTVDVARAAGARIVAGPRGRAAQMAGGVAASSGEWLVFLHADTWLEPGWAGTLQGLDGRVAGGAFRMALDSSRLRYRAVEAAVRLRCAILRLPYGDQGLFARRSALEGGRVFRDVPILEDVDLVRHLRRRGRLAFPAVRAVTSARRWEERGFWRTTLVNGSVMALAALGWPRENLARLYGGRSR